VGIDVDVAGAVEPDIHTAVFDEGFEHVPEEGQGTSMSATPRVDLDSTWMRVSLWTRSSVAVRRDAGPGLLSLIGHHPPS